MITAYNDKRERGGGREKRLLIYKLHLYSKLFYLKFILKRLNSCKQTKISIIFVKRLLTVRISSLIIT